MNIQSLATECQFGAFYCVWDEIRKKYKKTPVLDKSCEPYKPFRADTPAGVNHLLCDGVLPSVVFSDDDAGDGRLICIDVDTDDRSVVDDVASQFPHSYTEKSVSGRCHVWIRACINHPLKISDISFYGGKVEVYSSGRAIAVTNERVGNHPQDDINDPASILDNTRRFEQFSFPLRRQEAVESSGDPADLLIAPVNAKESAAVLSTLLSYLSPSDIQEPYNKWMDFTFSCHEITNGSSEGYNVYNEFCSRMSNYDAYESSTKWYSEGPKRRTVTGKLILASVYGCGDQKACSYVKSLGDYLGAGRFLRTEESEELTALMEVNADWCQVETAADTVAARWVPCKVGYRLETRRKASFFDYYRGDRHLVERKDSKGERKCISVGKIWWSSDDARCASNGIKFDPLDTPLSVCKDGRLNAWQGFFSETKKSINMESIQLYRDHVLKCICSRDSIAAEYIIRYLAHMIQKPEEKPSVAILMRSPEGTGKGLAMAPFANMLGPQCVSLGDPKAIVGKYNTMLENKLLTYFEEVFLATRTGADGCKTFISESTITIEHKYGAIYQTDNLSRVILSSNRDNPIKLDASSRRYVVVDGTYWSSDSSETESHTKKIAKMFKSKDFADDLYTYLLNYDISKFNPYKAVDTQALAMQKLSSLEGAGELIYRWLQDGRVDSHYGWPDTAEKSLTNSELLQIAQNQMKIDISSNAFGRMLMRYIGAESALVRKGSGVTRVKVFKSLEESKRIFCKLYGVPCDW